MLQRVKLWRLCLNFGYPGEAVCSQWCGACYAAEIDHPKVLIGVTTKTKRALRVQHQLLSGRCCFYVQGEAGMTRQEIERVADRLLELLGVGLTGFTKRWVSQIRWVIVEGPVGLPAIADG